MFARAHYGIQFLALCQFLLMTTVHALALPSKRVSIITGANGYLGREIVHALRKSSESEEHTSSQHLILCLVRSGRVEEEETYWKKESMNENCTIRVFPYDMIDGGTTLHAALEHAKESDGSTCIYHVASVFSFTEDHEKMAHDNVKGAEDLMKTVSAVFSKSALNGSNSQNVKVVMTSSMAAVRGSGQTPLNGQYYTHEDWNTLSKLGVNWGNSYQWSKAESEKISWRFAKKHNIPFVSICPSFIFGPPSRESRSKSFSISFVGSWIRGESPVQSRLCVDVRDVAEAHVRAGIMDAATGERIIVSREARIPSLQIGDELKRIAQEKGLETGKIDCDTDFDGGAIKIGDKEVHCEQRMKDLLNGLECRPVTETMSDMAQMLLEQGII
mmetsp:Transcript_22773/g.32124  ORF Transcript_22773/g.32124 Transcript_22773/m.32124 type:complete len:387 (+) Transcript_22773:102-1262(+)